MLDHNLGSGSMSCFTRRTSRPAAARSLLEDIAQTRHVFCLLQAELTEKLWERAAFGIPTDADIADLQTQMALLDTRLKHKRDALRQADVRAWRIHTFGLNVVLDEERQEMQRQRGSSCERSH